ncbi:general transcription factor IIF subunit 1 isoform X2 [Ischnura elegans]|uniref:general transcription factor IIF subunit 1 isoform X2 n=1 Tax=Ischnura elegans TaxID=197161 RepID=UPI001ED8BA8A|nr:general transcription factor IIF subunit 1 isoform X2 [Ischnura elegans]
MSGDTARVKTEEKAGRAVAPVQAAGTTVQEYVIRVPKNVNKKHHVMRFNTGNVDFTKWNQVKMERENNMKEYRGMDDETPKFGAGSEFGRDQREEARRKKFGIITKKYKPEDQPWILKVGGKTGKKFKGIREGGVGENAAYYVFTHAPDGAIEAFSLKEWYNFQPIQRYKALSAEEAEQEFGRRNKVMNYFSLMLRKRLRNDEEGDFEELEDGKGGKKGGKGAKGKGDLKISEMDDWVDSDDGDDESEEGEGEKDEDAVKEKQKKGAKAKAKAKKKRRDSNDEAVEESDDGDEEGREVDYISDSSDSEIDLDENVKDSMKGVAEEDALRKLLDSEEEDEEDKEGREDEGDDAADEGGEKDKEGGGDGGKGDSDAEGGKKKKGGKSSGGGKKDNKKKDPSSMLLNDSSSNYSSDSSDSETKKKPIKKEPNSGTNTPRSGTPTKGNSGSQDAQSSSSAPSASGSESTKRKNEADGTNGSVSKKPRMEGHLSSSFSSDSGITEEAVRRYLMRKPMTTTELLQKFKSKKTGLSSDQLVNVMTQILKRINPIKQTIKGKMYLSIKA